MLLGPKVMRKFGTCVQKFEMIWKASRKECFVQASSSSASERVAAAIRL
jgi:hypothetical protein